MLTSDAPAGTVVVGAGLAGLLTALRLARSGAAVTVVERSSQLGGYAGVQAHGAPWWQNSMLGLESGGSLAALLGDGAAWRAAPPERQTYLEIARVANETYALPGDLAGFVGTLQAHFSADSAALERFGSLLQEVHAAMASLGAIGSAPAARLAAMSLLRSLAGQEYRDFLRQRFAAPALQALLATRAFSSRNSALTMLAYLAKSLIDGMYAIPGGAAAITAQVVAELRTLPACTLLTDTAVVEIQFDAEQRANGVTLADGRRLEGSVVLNIDPHALLAGMVRLPVLCAELTRALAGYAPSLSALTLQFTPDAGSARAWAGLGHGARLFYSVDCNPFDVLAKREAGELDMSNCKINLQRGADGMVERIYVELDCSPTAAEFIAMTGREQEALAPLIHTIRRRLDDFVPGTDAGISAVQVITPLQLAALSGSRGGAASGFADVAGGLRPFDSLLAKYGLLLVGQWSSFGSGLSQLEASAVAAVGALVRRRMTGRRNVEELA